MSLRKTLSLSVIGKLSATAGGGTSRRRPASSLLRTGTAVALSALVAGGCSSVASDARGSAEPVGYASSALDTYPPNASCPASATAYCSEASQAMSAFLGGTTGQVAGGEGPGRTELGGNFSGGGQTWHDANTVEMILDYYAATGDQTYLPIVAAYKTGFDATHVYGSQSTFPWGVNNFMDDWLWWALAFIRAYDEIHDQAYLDDAKTIFHSTCGQWNVVPGCEGGIPQQFHGANPNSTIANELFFATAAKLAARAPNDDYVCDDTLPFTTAAVSQPHTPSAPGAYGVGGMSYTFQNNYGGWANAEYVWFKTHYFPNFPNGGAFPLPDSLTPAPDCQPHDTAWTYNQGPILGALMEMAAQGGAYGDDSATVQSLAYTIASQAMSHFSSANGGILTEDDDQGGQQLSPTGCFFGGPGDQNTGDCAEFKGIFMRYLGRLAYETWPTPDTGFLSFRSDATAFLAANANAVWQNHGASPFQLPVTWGTSAQMSTYGQWNYQPAMTSGLDAIIAAIPTQGPQPPAPPLPTTGGAPPVTVTGLSEYAGHSGDTITVTGTGFSTTWQMTSFSFGVAPGSPAVIPYYPCRSTTSCDIPVPTGKGTVQVTATVGLNTSYPSNLAIFQYEAPVVTSISPSSGGSTGGTAVTITGLGLDTSMNVYFGTVPSSNLHCNSPTTCWAFTPSYYPNTGVVDTTVVVDGIGSAPSPADRFTFSFLPPVPLKVSSSVSQLWTNETVDAEVTLNEPAPPGGTVVTLKASGPSQVPATGVTVPATVTVPAGASSVGFPITIAAQAIELVGVSASTPGSPYVGDSWWVYPGNVALANHAPSTISLQGGFGFTLSFVLRNPAGPSGDTLFISSSSPLLKAPASVGVPAGASTVSVPVSTSYVDVSANMTLTLGYQGVSNPLPFVVSAPPACVKKVCLAGYSWNADDCACELNKNACACGGTYPKCQVCQ